MLFLDSLLEICHRIVVSDELMEEWNRHTKRNVAFSRWLRRMFGRRKVTRCGPASDEPLRRRAVALAANDQETAEIQKDLHLLAIAIQHAAHVASLDERARSWFERLSSEDARVGSVVWVNPRSDRDAVIQWLQDGAPSTMERSLGGTGQQRA